MNSIRIFIFIFLFLILFKISYIQVNGHGLSTDISNPVDVPGKKIVVEAKLEPAYINNSIDYTDPKFLLRIYDQLTNQTISDLDYDIKIF